MYQAQACAVHTFGSMVVILCGLCAVCVRFVCGLCAVCVRSVCGQCADLCAVCVRSVCGLCAVCVRLVCGLCADLCAVCVRTLCAEEMSKFGNERVRNDPRVGLVLAVAACARYWELPFAVESVGCL